MSVRLTLPLKRALTGPIFTLTAACSSVSESFSRLSQPGMEARNVSASLSRAHTVARSAGSTNSPDIVTAMAHLSLEQSTLTPRARTAGPVIAGTLLPRTGEAPPAGMTALEHDRLAQHHSPRARAKAKDQTSGLDGATRASP